MGNPIKEELSNTVQYMKALYKVAKRDGVKAALKFDMDCTRLGHSGLSIVMHTFDANEKGDTHKLKEIKNILREAINNPDFFEDGYLTYGPPDKYFETAALKKGYDPSSPEVSRMQNSLLDLETLGSSEDILFRGISCNLEVVSSNKQRAKSQYSSTSFNTTENKNNCLDLFVGGEQIHLA
ncbi:MAG: hypothetical protein Q8O89_06675 [Nanoarchaeota archaeon]|nr:hypothetical protein [Nanoarchaeota archaeon]